MISREKAGAGKGPQTVHAARQTTPLARTNAADPLKGFQRPAATPLRVSPGGHHRCRVMILDQRDWSRRKELRMAATSALTLTPFSSKGFGTYSQTCKIHPSRSQVCG